MERKNIKELEKKIKELEKKCQEYLDGWKRAKADYLNLEKEMARQREEWIKFANWELIGQLIPILDSFDKAVKGIPSQDMDNPWAKGLVNIKSQFENILKNTGLERIKAVGEKFNPEFHEAVKKKGSNNRVAEELQAGYLWQGRVLRPAKVVIE